MTPADEFNGFASLEFDMRCEDSGGGGGGITGSGGGITESCGTTGGSGISRGHEIAARASTRWCAVSSTPHDSHQTQPTGAAATRGSSNNEASNAPRNRADRESECRRDMVSESEKDDEEEDRDKDDEEAGD